MRTSRICNVNGGFHSRYTANTSPCVCNRAAFPGPARMASACGMPFDQLRLAVLSSTASGREGSPSLGELNDGFADVPPSATLAGEEKQPSGLTTGLLRDALQEGSGMTASRRGRRT